MLRAYRPADTIERAAVLSRLPRMDRTKFGTVIATTIEMIARVRSSSTSVKPRGARIVEPGLRHDKDT
jgi:hypothetical protein